MTRKYKEGGGGEGERKGDSGTVCDRLFRRRKTIAAVVKTPVTVISNDRQTDKKKEFKETARMKQRRRKEKKQNLNARIVNEFYYTE